MRKLLAVIIIVGVVIAAAAYWYFSRPRLTEEEKVIRVIRDVKDAVVDKNAAGVLEHISGDYDDGTWTKNEIRGLILGGMRTGEQFHVHLEPPEVEVRGDRATAGIEAEFWTGPGRPRADSTRLDIEVEFAKEGGRWKVIRASGWEAAIDTGFQPGLFMDASAKEH